MNKYLEKIAKEYYQETRLEHDSIGNKVGLGVASAATVSMVNKKIGHKIQNRIGESLLNAEPTIHWDVLKKITEDVLPRTNSTMDLAEAGGTLAHRNFHEALGSASGPHYIPAESLNSSSKMVDRFRKVLDPVYKTGNKFFDMGNNPLGNHPMYDKTKPYTKNYVYAGAQKNTDALAHELGHAVDLNGKYKNIKLRADGFSRRMTGMPGALIGGAMLGSEKTRDYAWMAPLTGALPMLRSEAAANHNMSKLVAKHGGNPRNLKGIIAKNTASYLLAPLLTSGTIAGINHMRRKGEEVNPEEWLSDRD